MSPRARSRIRRRRACTRVPPPPKAEASSRHLEADPAAPVVGGGIGVARLVPSPDLEDVQPRAEAATEDELPQRTVADGHESRPGAGVVEPATGGREPAALAVVLADEAHEHLLEAAFVSG